MDIFHASMEADNGYAAANAVNIHHLELFYHVARCEGVSAAARQMPYGIQQSTISAQVLQLEDTLGKSLFRRRPFELTAEGRILFEFIEPFFSGLDALAERLRGGAENHLRIACPEIVQRDYLPRLLTAVRERMPGFHFSLESGRVAEIKERLRAGHIDLGLSTVAETQEPGIDCRILLQLPLALLVPAESALTSANEILDRDRIDLPLITLPEHEPSCRIFQEALQKRGIDWFPSLELASLDLIARYVAAGFGVGLCLRAPGWSLPGDVRFLELEGFPAVRFGALTSGRISEVAAQFIAEAETVARELMGD
jgi:DNA-binding transcriptional LysR family regulator